ncbi:uncharacterized protein ACNS7B_023392 isoform 1-T1 [Menidia menidia]
MHDSEKKSEKMRHFDTIMPISLPTSPTNFILKGGQLWVSECPAQGHCAPDAAQWNRGSVGMQLLPRSGGNPGRGSCSLSGQPGKSSVLPAAAGRLRRRPVLGFRLRAPRLPGTRTALESG